MPPSASNAIRQRAREVMKSSSSPRVVLQLDIAYLVASAPCAWKASLIVKQSDTGGGTAKVFAPATKEIETIAAADDGSRRPLAIPVSDRSSPYYRLRPWPWPAGSASSASGISPHGPLN